MSSTVVNVVTLGCSKNLVDSERLMSRIRTAGYTVIHDSTAANDAVVIINTCGFIDSAKEESIEIILQYAKARQRGDISKLYVFGCLSERYRTELMSEIPEVDMFFGVNSQEEISKELGLSPDSVINPTRLLTGPGHYAYLKIGEGCNRGCSFCAIPMIRGPYQSVPRGEVLQEASELASQGVKELILIAQDLTYYGVDLYKRRNIGRLVKDIAESEQFDWIRLHYLYPSAFPLSLLNVISDYPSICRYIDIPIQHITDRMLKMMKRGHSERETRELLNKVRERISDVAIRTTLIVGHPGEKRADYEALKKFVTEYRFERLGVFAYSHEENTPSWKKYKDAITEAEKEERVSEIMSIQQDISRENNTNKEGETVSVIIDRKEGSHYIARTQHDSPEIDQEVLIPIDKSLTPGTICDVVITESDSFDLFGRTV